MAMKNPVHPDAVVRVDCLKPLGLTGVEGVKRLSAGRQARSNLVNEKASISIEMTYRNRFSHRPGRLAVGGGRFKTSQGWITTTFS